ncbi:TPA: flagellar biosynthesis protein FlgA, partial [Burkholderia territorii]|nr:flagellar biosynthesis protein FlgA [Burkholderia territorii]
MTRAFRGNDGRGTRIARACALAAALWLAVPLAYADDGMIVIPGRGETAETALAHANAASGGQFGANAGTVSSASASTSASGTALASASTSGTGMPTTGGARDASGGAGINGAASAGSMVVTSVAPPAAVPAPASRPVYAAARANAGDGARRAAEP